MRLIKSFLFGSLFFVISSAAWAQTYTLQGVVKSESDEPVMDAHVYLSENKWAVTDDNGYFRIESVAPGTYTVTVSRIGYRTKTLEVVLNQDQPRISDLSVILKERIYDGEQVVVTASRTRKDIEDVSVPVTVIDEQEIASSGSLRLSDVLNEQIGLNLVNDHGTGIQLQGFDPEYTLILIDNQPVIGRTAGTLNLDRLAIGNVKQIEMVKGPSSALWGSDALAGVINIITEKGSDPLNWDMTGRYGSNTSYDASSNLSFNLDHLTGSFFVNSNGSDGFDLSPSTITPTIPQYDNLTLSGRLNYRLNSRLSLGLNTRYYQERQVYDTEIIQSNRSVLLSGNDYQDDFSISPEVTLTLSEKILLEGNAFFSTFYNESKLDYASDGQAYSYSTFDQSLNKIELKGSGFWNTAHTTVAGAGMNREDLKAEIYADVPYFDSFFAFGQHEWAPQEKLSFTGGFRFDVHSEYSSQFSPKFSGLYKPNDLIHLRASLGGGFKAPDFRQLFLNFTNPTAGYSVFGASTIAEGINELRQLGQIEELYYDPSSINELNAERSFAYNLGLDLFPAEGLQLRVNGFRNNVDDLIETQRVALKTNGQSVFGYFNLNRIYTQGIESELRYRPDFLKGLRLSLGYQYLDARREITRTFDRVVNGQVISVSETLYVPMFNRSEHTGNFKIFYLLEESGLEASFRVQYRGKFGFADFNSNQVIDPNEYAEAHTILNVSLAKTFFDRYRLLAGIDNLTNYTNALYLPSNPGTTFYAQLTVNLY